MPRIKFEDGSTLEGDLNLNLGTCENGKIVHKFGTHLSVGTTFSAVSIGGIYQMPQVGSATKLRVKAGNANDAAAGSGARAITIFGIDTNGNEVSETLTPNGTSAGSNSTNDYIRLYRAFVSESGTYATTTTGSHAADVVIENSAGNADWLTITGTDYPHGQSDVAFFTAPASKQAYLLSAVITTDSSKTTDVLFFVREGILEAAAPYSAMRERYATSTGGDGVTLNPKTPLGPYTGPCDMGWMAKVDVGTAIVSIDYEILLVDT